MNTGCQKYSCMEYLIKYGVIYRYNIKIHIIYKNKSYNIIILVVYSTKTYQSRVLYSQIHDTNVQYIYKRTHTQTQTNIIIFTE